MNYTRPQLAIALYPIRNAFADAKNRGVRLRYLTEITSENISYCKLMLSNVSELRHLDGIKGNFMISESEYLAPAVLFEEGKVAAQIIYSNVKQLVEEHEYVFDTLWSKAISSQQRIMEIEEGVEHIETKVLENKEQIFNHIKSVIGNASERSVCSSIGAMQLVYNNFFEEYKKIMDKHRRYRQDKGIRWITSIIDKDNIGLVKIFLNEGIQVRHVRNLTPMNFAVDNKHFYATIEKMDKGELMDSLLVSNEPAYIKHFMLFFQELWNNYGVDANERIRDIEEGLEYETEVIIRSDRALDLYLGIVQSSQTEILLILPTPKAFIRQIKAIFLAKQISKEKKVKVRILTPINETVEKWIKCLLQNEENDGDGNNRYPLDLPSHPDMQIRYIEKMSQTKATILVADRKESLVIELKDDAKDTFVKAIGICTHSNSKSNVLSYVAIFENLWKQSELYREIKESNEKLESKDRVLNEFIHIAAHELRTPIQPILALSQIVKSGLSKKIELEADKDKILNMLDVIIRNSKNLYTLSNNVLDIAKIETNSLALNMESFNLKDLLQVLIDDCKSQQRDDFCDIEFYVDIEGQQHQKQNDNPFIVEADKARISQVVSNLLTNALKFTNKDCLIQVILKEKEIDFGRREVIVTVKDTGTGIDTEILPNLFTKFATKSEKGTGLGLYVCKNIITSHGGRIWAENNKDGQGATFSFSLPRDNWKK